MKRVAFLMVGMCIYGCAKMGSEPQTGNNQSDKKMSDAQADAGEVKLKIDQTPPPVRATIERELAASGDLEDISKQTGGGATVYEVDIFAKAGGKLEVRVAPDGSVLSRTKEGSDEKTGEKEADAKVQATDAGWRDTFDVEKEDLAPTGNNPWLTIQPGRKQVMRNGIDTLTITILDDTPTIDGVKVGVLEERETKNGKLEEVSRNFFATDKETGDVYYLGEDVDMYRDGKIVSHEERVARRGEGRSKFGLMIPAKPKVGDKFYQEIGSQGGDGSRGDRLNRRGSPDAGGDVSLSASQGDHADRE